MNCISCNGILTDKESKWGAVMCSDCQQRLKKENSYDPIEVIEEHKELTSRQRLIVCSACPMMEINPLVGMVCGKLGVETTLSCGCILGIKSKFSTLDCPQNKWAPSFFNKAELLLELRTNPLSLYKLVNTDFSNDIKPGEMFALPKIYKKDFSKYFRMISIKNYINTKTSFYGITKEQAIRYCFKNKITDYKFIII